jgi:uncharacterized alkaline shock family protein YloU
MEKQLEGRISEIAHNIEELVAEELKEMVASLE